MKTVRKKLLKRKAGFCFWGENDESSPRLYFSGCKKNFYFEAGDAKSNSFRFCPFCGAKIATGRYGSK